VSLAGVRSWYDEHGDGDPLVLLHPALSRSTDGSLPGWLRGSKAGPTRR
jgi:hypothetical protein